MPFDDPSKPLTPIPTLQQQPQQPMTKTMSDALRKYASDLLSKHMPAGFGIGGIGSGLDNATRSMMAGLYGHQADEADLARARSNAGGAIPENPYGAGSGGAGNNPPFTASPPSEDGGTGETGQVPDNLVAFIKDREGFKPVPYDDGKQVSIGYGTRARVGERSITREEAERRLNDEVGRAASLVDQFDPNLPAGARSALIDLTYNAGNKWTTAGLGKAVRDRDWDTAKNLFLQYNHDNGAVSRGLTTRRQMLASALSPGGGYHSSPGEDAPSSVEATDTGAGSVSSPAGSGGYAPTAINPVNTPGLDVNGLFADLNNLKTPPSLMAFASGQPSPPQAGGQPRTCSVAWR